jgi:hypothetical protein
MAKLLGAHWPHLIFVAIGVIAFLWTAFRPERGSESRAAGGAAIGSEGPLWAQEGPPPAPPAPAGSVRRSVARRGLLALGPLLGAVATGAILYGVDVGGSSVPGAVIWVHSGISLLALLLVVYKVADLGVARIRLAFTRERLPELVSIVLGVLSLPLVVTGVGLLLVPSTRSFMAYSHLISSAWWTGLMLWHLRRYLGPSLRAVGRREPVTGPSGSPARTSRCARPGSPALAPPHRPRSPAAHPDARARARTDAAAGR